MNKPTVIILSTLPFFILGTLIVWVLSYGAQSTDDHLKPSDSYIRHFLFRGLLDSGVDYPSGNNGFSIDKLKPGDLIFCHNHRGAYGFFTHCSIYLGDGNCTEQNLADGMYIGKVADLSYGYEQVWIMRAPINQEQRQQVCEFAKQYTGSVFDMSARKDDPRLWNCAKLCWAAYASIDIDLSPSEPYVLPDFLAIHPALDTIERYYMPGKDQQ